MKVLIVHAHPESQSFNAALTRHAVAVLTEAGHEVRVSDLYAMGWDPVSDRRNFTTQADPGFYRQQKEEEFAATNGGFAPDIREEMAKLEWCDTLIFQFPLWWFGMPAILKGWVERVLAYGFAYGRGRWYEHGVFAGKRAMVSTTTGGPEAMYVEGGINGRMDMLLFPINHGAFCFTGFEVLPPFVTYEADRGGEEVRRVALARYTERLLSLETTTPIRYPSIDDYDSDFRPKVATVH